MQRVAVTTEQIEVGASTPIRDDLARARALRLHDQMLSTMAWVIEEATELNPDAPPLDPLYDAFDFLAALRERVATGKS